jgi:hypothetical protein
MVRPMEDTHVTSAFFRNDDGTWICINPVTLDHPKGSIQLTPGSTFVRGASFMGTNIAAWLEQQLRERPLHS